MFPDCVTTAEDGGKDRVGKCLTIILRRGFLSAQLVAFRHNT